MVEISEGFWSLREADAWCSPHIRTPRTMKLVSYLTSMHARDPRLVPLLPSMARRDHGGAVDDDGDEWRGAAAVAMAVHASLAGVRVLIIIERVAWIRCGSKPSAKGSSSGSRRRNPGAMATLSDTSAFQNVAFEKKLTRGIFFCQMASSNLASQRKSFLGEVRAKRHPTRSRIPTKVPPSVPDCLGFGVRVYSGYASKVGLHSRFHREA